MYYNRNLKTLLFDFRNDINYNCWLIIYILKVFECNNSKNSFKDHRKINFIINFIINDHPIYILINFFNGKKLNSYETHILSSSYFKSILEENTVNSAFLLLEKLGMINFCKTKKSVNVYYNKSIIDEEYSKYIHLEEKFEVNIIKILDAKINIYNLKYDKILEKIQEIGESNNEKYHY